MWREQPWKLPLAVVLAIAIGVLGFLLIQRTSTYDADPDRSSAILPSAEPTEAEPSPVDPEISEAENGALAVSVAANNAVFRYSEGACNGSKTPVLGVSTNGVSFETISLPAGVASIFTMSAVDEDQIGIIAAGSDCEGTRYTTDDGGDSWTKAKANAWFIHPIKERVIGPSGPVDAGCTSPLYVAAFDEDEVVVMCESGTVLTSVDGGESWDRSGKLNSVQAVDFVSLEGGIALGADEACMSRASTTADGGETWIPQGCIKADGAQSISTSGAVTAALVDGDLYVSADGGVTWAMLGA